MDDFFANFVEQKEIKRRCTKCECIRVGFNFQRNLACPHIRRIFNCNFHLFIFPK